MFVLAVDTSFADISYRLVFLLKLALGFVLSSFAIDMGRKNIALAYSRRSNSGELSEANCDASELSPLVESRPQYFSSPL